MSEGKRDSFADEGKLGGGSLGSEEKAGASAPSSSSSSSSSSSMGSTADALDFAELRDEVCSVIQRSILAILDKKTFQASSTNSWVDDVNAQVLTGLREASPNFKYVVSCMIAQKNGSGLQCTSSCFWDPETDGSCTVRWENKTMSVVVVVFGLAL